jgi:KUP system potassium uptake protein
MQLGWFPGVRINQTSDEEYGQIYVPFVNWAMMLGTLALTAAFRSSDALAGAYGSAVSTTMLLTTALLYNAMRDVWGWNRALALVTAGGFLLVDLGFFAANMMKVREGGWIPLALGALLFVAMTTWHRGIEALRARIAENPPSPEDFYASLAAGNIPRVPGTAVFLTRSTDPVSPIMVRHVAQMKALQETVVSLTVRFEQIPRVGDANRAEVENMGHGLWHITVHFGFVEIPSLAEALAVGRAQGCPLDLEQAIYFAANDAVVACKTTPRLPAWRRMLFAFMYRNAVRAPDRFDLPQDRFVEVGRQLAL